MENRKATYSHCAPLAPALICAKPDCVTLGVNVSLESIATLVLPAYIDATTLLPPELASVSIWNPDSV